MPTARLLLVDGMAYVYRAFHAIRSLSTSDGRATNAMYGFIRQFEAICRTVVPTHRAVVFDGGLPKERLELLPEYKAQRPPMPPEMRVQLPLISTYLDFAGVKQLRMDAEEADDVIATLARQYAKAGMGEVLIASPDKDLMQLVSPDIRMVSQRKGVVNWVGVEDVIEKTGVSPTQVVDWLAMVGDSADNIPGVRHVGPKTAAIALAEGGSLAQIWENPGLLQSKRTADLLVAERALLVRNQGMVRLRTQLFVEPDWNEFISTPADVAGLLALYDDLEFAPLAAALRQPTLF